MSWARQGKNLTVSSPVRFITADLRVLLDIDEGKETWIYYYTLWHTCSNRSESVRDCISIMSIVFSSKSTAAYDAGVY